MVLTVKKLISELNRMLEESPESENKEVVFQTEETLNIQWVDNTGECTVIRLKRDSNG